MKDDFNELVAITDARFRAEQAKLRDILQEEKRLRDKASELEAAQRGAQLQYASECAGQRIYGGDVLWLGWIGRARRQLQIELARVLVEKGKRMSALSHAHGRKIASESLESDARRKERAESQKQDIEQEQALFLLDHWFR
ncbi:hypothetical protein XM53_17170 [Roseovarius atlanticus]|uniref:Flagellar FliJ protein n=1 Tax=Roseovarius atlanticus TaxID=1641875 RepID=A0A0T5NQR5_9RHOB|nr:hypothetical protein [Roseovarius atlanticus]KRS11309.1 hypothetical protein XM53_17170 [Roseovarius atlanticus]